MNHNKKKNLPSKYILLILTIFCAAIIVSSIFLDVSSGPFTSVFGRVFVPMQKGVNHVGQVLSDFRDNFESKKELQAENEELREQIVTLQEELNLVQLNQDELDSLKELYEMDQAYSDYDKLAASVIGKDSGNWFSTFIIDKGTDDGVDVGMNILADGGLCGIVIETGSNFAKVRAIIDDMSNVSAEDISTDDLCIVSGSLQSMNQSSLIEFSDLRDADDEVSVGDQLVTSNVSDLFLPGLPIGYIMDLETDANNLTKSGHLAVIADFENMDQVFVILQEKEQTSDK